MVHEPVTSKVDDVPLYATTRPSFQVEAVLEAAMRASPAPRRVSGPCGARTRGGAAPRTDRAGARARAVAAERAAFTRQNAVRASCQKGLGAVGGVGAAPRGAERRIHHDRVDRREADAAEAETWTSWFTMRRRTSRCWLSLPLTFVRMSPMFALFSARSSRVMPAMAASVGGDGGGQEPVVAQKNETPNWLEPRSLRYRWRSGL